MGNSDLKLRTKEYALKEKWDEGGSYLDTATTDHEHDHVS